ncbi:MAG: alpha/beta hydrolase [Pseudomonadales bacterium]
MTSTRTLNPLVLLLAFGAAAGHAAEAWQIESRVVPPPAGASEALRESIAATPAPDLDSRRRSVPRTRAEWDAAIAERAAARPVSLEDLERTFAVDIARDRIAGVRVHRITPQRPQPAHEGHLFLYVHGGAYVYGGGDSGITEAAVIARMAGMDVISIDYRMPPAHPFPAAVDDVVDVYRDVLDGHAPGAIAMGGTSAGGGLALAAVHRFKALDLPVPGAVYAGTPWADLTKTGDTLFTNEGLDRVLVTYDGSLGAAARLYADGHDLTDPLLSPVYGDFSGFPPVYLVTGTRDLFLSDTARTHRKLRQAGVMADLNVYEGMSHAGYAFNQSAPEWRQVYGELAAFLQAHLD